MLSYVIKRLLIMIPTFIGVSIAIWLVMTLAPGKPSGTQGGGAPGGNTGTDKLGDLQSQGQNERMFRDQFGINRPRFINTWTGLEADDLRESITILREGRKKHGIKKIGEVRDELEDYGHYAIPALVDLLENTEGDEQAQVLAWLRRSAYQFPPVHAEGYQRTTEEVADDERISRENKELDSDALVWDPKATQEERAETVANWKTWYAKRNDEGRWSYRDSFWEKVGLGITDTQFGKYWSNLVRFDFGKSMKSREPVRDMILGKLKYSLSLAVPSFLIAWILAIFLGVTSAVNHNKWPDQGIGIMLFMLYSIPSFLMATVLQKWWAVDWEWFPVTRFSSVNADQMTTWEHFKDILHHLVLPLVCYTYGSLAFISRQARSGMLEVMQSDFIRTARAKGVKERTVIWKHAVRNGMMPIITLLGTALPVLLGGSVVIEVIFDIPGFGKAMLDAILTKDYNVVLGIALISSALTLIGLLIADILYAAVDPRVSFE